MIAAIPLITSALGALTQPAPSLPIADAGKAAVPHADFGQVMAKLANEALHNVNTAETVSVDGLQGHADLQSVVQSVMAAQESLQTALAIRDKSVAAFQEVTRMSI